MLSRLAKSLAIKASTSRTVQPLAKYLGDQISAFWHTPRVPVPRPAAAKPRPGGNDAFNSQIRDQLLYFALACGGTLLTLVVVDTVYGKYRLLKKAKHEWDAKSEHEKRISTMEMKGGRLCLSGAQDQERVDGVDLKILSLGKWAWIMRRFTEMEQEAKAV